MHGREMNVNLKVGWISWFKLKNWEIEKDIRVVRVSEEGQTSFGNVKSQTWRNVSKKKRQRNKRNMNESKTSRKKELLKVEVLNENIDRLVSWKNEIEIGCKERYSET